VSKAFTRESDDAGEELPLRPRAPLPPGTRNYITSAGAQRLREELAQLEQTSGRENSRRDARLRQLREIIESLVVAEPPVDREVIRFGATVTVRRSNGTEQYRLVGVDETDLDANEISWLSPLARALIGKRAGDRVQFRAPSGVEELVIDAVSYD
jgi:transcription elongation factor GreB